MNLSVLWEERGVLLVNKPPGVPTAGDRLMDAGSVQFALMEANRGRMVWAIHQLDRDTSGLNLFVKKKSLVEPWSRALGEGRKEYLAICHGRVRQDVFVIDDPLGWIVPGRKRGVVASGKDARTEVHVLARSGDFSFLRVILHTGRTHQIRLHLAHHNHPLVGERRYCIPPCEEHERHALHAWRLEVLGEVFVAPVPLDFEVLMEDLGMRWP